MDIKPTRPSRAVRARHDENAIHPTMPTKNAVNQKAVTTATTGSTTTQGAGAQATARRAFGDVSNVTKAAVGKSKKETAAKNAKIILETKEQLAVRDALSKPAQRNATRAAATTAATTLSKQTHAPGPARRVVKKTEVYADKKISPKKSKISPRKAIIRRDAKKIAPIRPESKDNIKSKKRDFLTFSDQPSHSYPNTESTKVEEDEYDEDATDVEEYKTSTEVVSDDDYYEDEDEEDEYTTARSRPVGDNTTDLTTQVIIPRMTAQDRKELDAAAEKYGGIDEDDVWDITMVAEYGDDIFDYCRDLEEKMLPSPNYMDHQPDIQWSMRSILMNWLVQVHYHFGLLPETLFLCANYIDRFLSRKVVSLNKLQLVGATALFLATKYEEVQSPSVHEIVFMVDHGFTVEDILKAERFMLTMLDYELGWPGPMSFLRRVSKADDYDLETRTLAKYFLELTIMDERFVGSQPSFLAAGAHYLARLMLYKGDWTTAHTHFSGYTKNQLLPLIKIMAECCVNPKDHHKAVYEKYTERRFKRASLFVENWVKSSGTLSELLKQVSSKQES